MYLCLGVLVTLLGPVVAAPANCEPTASLASDRTVIGTATTLPSATVNKFLGIPFAKRFEMMVFNNPGGPPPPESEDCLYLNIYAPSGPPPPQGWPVMFWLYGGNLAAGDASTLWYDGSHIAANQGVVVVSPNYRTNVFGFPNAPEIATDAQNLGFLDQRKALRWVTHHIKAFNGDPSKITIFGQSAGGYSVLQLLANPPKPLPFHAAIVESYGDDRGKGGADSWLQLANATGCASPQSGSSLDCMRKVDATQIQKFIEAKMISFPPAYDNITCTKSLLGAFEAHQVADVPLLIGSNANEATVFITQLGVLPPGNSTNVEEVLSLVKLPQSLWKTAIALYPNWYTPFQLAAQLFTDASFTCKTALLSDIAAVSGYKVWRYWYNGTFPNEQLFPGAAAWHTSEIPQVFGTYLDSNATDGQKRLSALMQNTWAQFSKAPTNGPGWARVGSNDGTWVHDFESSGTGVTVSNRTTDFLSPLVLQAKST